MEHQKKNQVLEALAEKDDQRTEEEQRHATKRSKFVHAGAAGPMRVVKNGFTIQRLQSQVLFFNFIEIFFLND